MKPDQAIRFFVSEYSGGPTETSGPPYLNLILRMYIISFTVDTVKVYILYVMLFYITVIFLLLP